MFGHRFFGARYFGPRYWGPAVAGATPSRGGADYGWEKVERARERAWQAAREAQAELRRSLEDLIRGRPAAEVKETVAEVRHEIEQATVALEPLPAFDGLRAAFAELQQLLAQLIRQRTLRQGEMRRALEAAMRLEAQFSDDEDAIVAILIAGA